jgi:hypothetical protein
LNGQTAPKRQRKYLAGEALAFPTGTKPFKRNYRGLDIDFRASFWEWCFARPAGENDGKKRGGVSTL